MKLSLAVQTNETPDRSPISLLSGSLDEMAAKAAGWGADGVELMPVDVSLLNPDTIYATFARQRLEICAVGTALFAILGGMTLLDPDAEKAARAKDRLFRAVEFASAVGAPLLTIGGFRGRFSALGAEGRGRFIEILRRAGDIASLNKVRIVLEPINHFQSDGIASAAEGLKFLADLDHSSVGLLIDTCHMTTEESSWTEPFRQVMAAGKLWHVHLAESNRLPPGNGLVDFPSILNVLKELGYDRHLTLEVFAKPDPDTAARQGLTYIREMLAAS
jgi:sugar phosphate isomerase/epimerase